MLVGGIVDCLGGSQQAFTHFINSDYFMVHIRPLLKKKFTWGFTPLCYLMYHCMYSAQITPVLMAYNRMCSLCFPLKYNMLWKHYKIILFVAYAILPYSLAFYLPFNKAGLTFDNTTLWFNYTGFDYDHTFTLGIVDAEVTQYLSVICALLGVTCNFINVCMLIRHRINGYITGKREVNFVICCTINFIAQCLVAAGQYIFISGIVNIYVALRFILPVTIGSHFVLPGLVIVASIAPLRHAVLRPFMTKKSAVMFLMNAGSSNFTNSASAPNIERSGPQGYVKSTLNQYSQ
ncbi:unnamed protein product [Bursaphelenchus okinawaensis]|uniref:Serpentine receptor class gamma n=1 Tax=Bursaphelenchus okinawaensis TaxID=465554 RepID=A0A811KCV3_9BILA|nr:unnamed protein product [Bursaphelenchus okinawaensis]CAG9101879.1 unnamed protein product [Bursaphelenchus okinawaensis]